MKNRYLLPTIFLALMIVFSGCTESDSEKGNSNNTKKENPAISAGQDIKIEPGQSTELQFSHFNMVFGPVVSGDTVRAKYPFKNMSNRTVSIKQIATSCKCLTAMYPTGNIHPGQIGEIAVKFETAGFFGTHEKIIAVVLNDNIDPITLRLNGRITKAQE